MSGKAAGRSLSWLQTAAESSNKVDMVIGVGVGGLENAALPFSSRVAWGHVW